MSSINSEYWIYKCYLDSISAVLKNQIHEAPIFLLDFMLYVFLVTLVEIKLASVGVGGNRGMKNGVGLLKNAVSLISLFL